MTLLALVSERCCWHLKVLPTQEREWGDCHHSDATPNGGSDLGHRRELGGSAGSNLSVCGEWVHREQMESHWEGGSAITADWMPRRGAVSRRGRGCSFPGAAPPEALDCSLTPL